MEILTHIKDKGRYNALDGVQRAVVAIFKYYDRKENKYDAYEKGFDISQRFQEVCG